MFFQKRLLEQPWAYDNLMKIFGRKESLRLIVDRWITPTDGERILDLGCGTATILASMSNVEYTGIDNNSRYIQKAEERFGQLGKFICADLNDEIVATLGTFEKILLLGVMHHLPDVLIKQTMETIPKLLGSQGVLITLDPAFEENQHPVARILARMDRGRFVRSTDDYVALIQSKLTVIDQITLHDLNRMPYTHAVIKAKRNSVLNFYEPSKSSV
jgi:SAM-dependent methyltransferase